MMGREERRGEERRGKGVTSNTLLRGMYVLTYLLYNSRVGMPLFFICHVEQRSCSPAVAKIADRCFQG